MWGRFNMWLPGGGEPGATLRRPPPLRLYSGRESWAKHVNYLAPVDPSTSILSFLRFECLIDSDLKSLVCFRAFLFRGSSQTPGGAHAASRSVSKFQCSDRVAGFVFVECSIVGLPLLRYYSIAGILLALLTQNDTLAARPSSSRLSRRCVNPVLVCRMDSTSQPPFSSPPLYPTQSPSSPDMVNGVQFGRGMMGAGARDTVYDSRRLEGHWESDWNRDNSRFTDYNQQPLYVNADLHYGPTHDFTQNLPHWDQLLGNSGVMHEAEAFLNSMTENLPQAHVPMHPPTIYQGSPAHQRWSEELPSQSTWLPLYAPARTQRMVPFGKRSPVTTTKSIN
jgi:hypothetical protein